MDDREMLYLAAEAAGLRCNGHYPDKNGYVCLSSHTFSSGYFSPLDFNTGHALILQARLGISIDMNVVTERGFQTGWVQAYHDDGQACEDVTGGACRVCDMQGHSKSCRCNQRVAVMTTRQRTRRMLIWRGSFSALSLCTFLMLLGALADRITS